MVGKSIGGTSALDAAVRTLTISNGAHIGASTRSVANWKQIIETQDMNGLPAHMMQTRFDAMSDNLRLQCETQQATAPFDDGAGSAERTD